jgi:cold shock CspA family protein
VQMRRGFVKRHVGPPEGRVVRLVPELECGFIGAEGDREIYFHSHAVLEGDWKRIEVGSRVSFAEEQGDHGPQASSVRLMKSPRRHSASS